MTNGIPDHKETVDFGMEEEFEPECREPWKVMRGPNLFPDAMSELRETTIDSMADVNDVGRIIMEGYALGFKLQPDFFGSHFHRPSTLLRFIKYPPTSGEKIGIGEHSDYGCLTMIDQDDVGGLQAKSLEGEWLDVTPI